MGRCKADVSEKQRFWQKVRKSGNDECWEWTAARCRFGYGRFTVDGRDVAAHRYSWESYNGKIPDGLLVLHHCDNPGCVNPNHLFLGTQQDNVDDMMAKGRGFFPGPKDKTNIGRHLRKLSVEQVKQIKKLSAHGFSQSMLGRMFGVTSANISSIQRGITWKRVVV